MILIAVALIGLLTAAISQSTRPEGSNIDKETLALRVSEVQRTASELERAITFIQQNGISESAIRFAHYNAHADYGDLAADGDKRDQVFDREGGGATYREPPAGVNDGSAWEFYGGTHIPGIGRDDRAELVAVLPHVTQAFCDRINEANEQEGDMIDDGTSSASGGNAGSCVNLGAVGRFDDSTQFYPTINTMDESASSFTHQRVNATDTAVRPAPQGCVQCSVDTNGANGTSDELHFYHVLLSR